MPTRGIFKFETTAAGVVDSAANVEALRRLWLDREMIDGDDLGPGDQGDFDHGAWHVACHVVAGGGVKRTRNGDLLWLEVSHNGAGDGYYASVTSKMNGRVSTERVDSAVGRRLLEGATLCGFVEGNSLGHISARGVTDPPDRFNLWKRQDFDRPVSSREDGGKVWEHWCTVRDIRPSHRIGSSVLKAYVTLMAELGDRFVAAVTRGRRSYGHPKQLCAMVRGGLTSEESATWNITPSRIPPAAEKKFLEATPADALAAAETLTWEAEPRYYMFSRKIASWSPAAKVRADLRGFGR